MTKFPCTGCGICCRVAKQAADDWQSVIAKSDNTRKEKRRLSKLMAHPYGFDETGKCNMLADDNSCKVYENRPSMCNIEAARKIMGWGKEEYYRFSISMCNSLMDKFNIDQKFRINA